MAVQAVIVLVKVIASSMVELITDVLYLVLLLGLRQSHAAFLLEQIITW